MHDFFSCAARVTNGNHHLKTKIISTYDQGWASYSIYCNWLQVTLQLCT